MLEPVAARRKTSSRRAPAHPFEHAVHRIALRELPFPLTPGFHAGGRFVDLREIDRLLRPGGHCVVDRNPRRANGVVHLAQVARQVRPVEGRHQVAELRRALRVECVEGVFARLVLQAHRLRFVQQAELGIHPGGDRVLAQQAQAEAVHRRDPCLLHFAQDVAARGEGVRQLLPHVERGALGERDGQDARRPDARFH